MLEDVNDANIARTMDHSDTTLPEKKHIYIQYVFKTIAARERQGD